MNCTYKWKDVLFQLLWIEMFVWYFIRGSCLLRGNFKGFLRTTVRLRWINSQLLRRLQRLPENNGGTALISSQLLKRLQRLPENNGGTALISSQLLRRLQRLPENNGGTALISSQLLRRLQRLPENNVETALISSISSQLLGRLQRPRTMSKLCW